MRVCSNGGVLDSCAPGIGDGVDDSCNGIDEDCDGHTDGGYVSVATTCGGSGVCAGAGGTSCVDGETLDSCMAGTATGADDDCNGIDEDCSGTADDNYADTATTCGAGECAATGTLSCVDGNLADSCVPAPDCSVCEPACGAGETCDSGTCVPDTATCDPACGAGETCTDGRCVPDTATCDPACGAGETCTDGACVPDTATCDPACGAGETCTDGACTDDMSTTTGNDSGGCAASPRSGGPLVLFLLFLTALVALRRRGHTFRRGPGTAQTML
ncbi:MAG: hypothetical protein ACI9MR_004369 [Myxococcota bacterium]|jgi:uncharacterized protein (TIGR03382 family)